MSEAILEVLTDIERSELTQYEAVIERNLAVFYETGQALLRIRDARLYRATHSTFEEYCRERWGMGRAHAYRLIESAQVVKNLSPMGDKPTSERQARELASLEPEQQREVWQVAIETAPNGNITAAHVRETREAFEDCETMDEVDEAFHVGKPHVAHNSGNNEWYTPPEYIEAARQVLGKIDLDPASSATANEIIKATRFYTIEDDGLSKKWSGRVWMNPPYSGDLVSSFVERLIDHWRNGSVTEAIVLVNNATETGWFQSLTSKATVCFPKGRIRYLDATGTPVNSPLQGQAVVYLGPKVKEFEKAFSHFGIIKK